MTCEEALNTCKMALKAIGMSHSPQNDYNSVAEFVKEMSKEHDIETLMMCVERQIPKKFEIWNGQDICPNCKSVFGPDETRKMLIHWEMDYCKYCGQALDWSDEE